MSAMTAINPTVLLVQGSFQLPLVYQGLTNALNELDYPVVQPRLPSLMSPEDSNSPAMDLIDDALAVRSELTRQIEYEGKTVIVAMHSYGGLVGNEAIPEDLTLAKRQAKGLDGGVIHMFYFCAFILDKGLSVLEAFGESPNNVAKPNGRFIMKGAKDALYNGLPDEEAELWESRLITQSYNVQTTKLTQEAYRYISSTYLICEKDHAVPPQFQEAFAKKIGAKIEKCEEGHSPMLTSPKMLARKIVEAAQVAVAKEKREALKVQSE